MTKIILLIFATKAKEINASFSNSRGSVLTPPSNTLIELAVSILLRFPHVAGTGRKYFFCWAGQLGYNSLISINSPAFGRIGVAVDGVLCLEVDDFDRRPFYEMFADH